MAQPGQVGLHTLPDGRVLEYWDGGDADGRPLLLHQGTPVTYALSVPHHEEARLRGVRIVSPNRAGYGRSSPSTASLTGGAADGADLMRGLGCLDFAVVGVSGGGPYAAATAVVAPDAVRALGVLGGIGPWPRLSPPEYGDTGERAVLAGIGDDGPEGVRAQFLALAETDLGGLSALDAQSRVEAFLAGFSDPLLDDPRLREAWAQSLQLTFDGPYGLDGYVSDNLAWGGPWDVDLSTVTAPTLLWYGDEDTSCPVAHGAWYADRIPGATMTVLPGQGHLSVCDANWPLVLEELLAVASHQEG